MPGLPMLKALWAYRSFVWSSVLREFHGKYRESLLGAFWSVANPLAMIVIYTVVFGQLMRPKLAGHEQTPFAFSIYLCAGVITWGLFGEMLGRLNNVFLEHGNLIKKSNFPRICLPAIVVASALVVLACCANAAPGTAATVNKAKAMAADKVSRPCLRVICFISLPLLD